MRNIVGYVHTVLGYSASCLVQQNLIREYCQEQEIYLNKMFIDNGTQISLVEMEGIRHMLTQRKKGYSARRKLLQEIQKGEIECILVDSILRLTVNPYETQDIMEWCKKQKVTVIEVNLNNMDEAMESKVAVYHYTDGATVHRRVVEKDIDKLYEFVSSHDGWRLQGLYLDSTLVKTDQIKYREVRTNADRYDILLTKDFYHIQIKTSTFWTHVMQMLQDNIKIETIVDGNIEFFYEPSWLDRELSAAVYYRNAHKMLKSNLRIEALQVFVSLKTNWKLERIYTDYKEAHNDNQPELGHLLSDITNYDIILVDNFATIHFRTAQFAKIVKKLGKPIFSMKEGGILL